MTPAVDTRLGIPFQGLRYFDEEQVDLFFGRDDQIREALEKLAESRFVTVIGSSGSGKSSLVRAGLFPALRSGLLGGVSPHWRIAKCMPGEMPVRALARSIEGVFGVRGIELTLRRGPLGLVEASHQCGLAKNENLLIFVDQFEEIFRYERVARNRAAAREEAAAFVKLLIEASQTESAPIYVVLTMRSDYLGSASNFRDLPECINRGLYLIPRMTRDQIEEAIRGPIALANARISASLAQRLLNDLGDSMDQLPVLQHAMLRTWLQWKGENRPGEPLDLSHYTQVGGLQRGLSNHANEIYNGLAAGLKPVCEALFRCLTERDAGERDTRRPTEVAVIARVADVHPDLVRQVADLFRAPGTTFLMPPLEVPLEDSTKLDITHESLIRNWDKLCGTADQKGWVQDEAELRDQFHALVKRAGRHRTEDDLLRGGDLDDAVHWRSRRLTSGWAERYGADPESFARVVSYIEESDEKRKQEREQARLAAERVKREREKRRFQRIAWGIAVLIGAFAFWAARANMLADRARDDAARANAKAERQQMEALSDQLKRADEANRRERELHTEAERQRQEAELQRREAILQRDLARELNQVSTAREWLGQPDPEKIGRAVTILTAILQNRNSFPEARLGAASDLHRIPLSTLSQPAFQGLAAALHNSATSDPDPKVKTAAIESIAAHNDSFLGHWKGSGSTIAALSVDRKPQGIQISATRPCPPADCELGSGLVPLPQATLIESYSVTLGALSVVISRGRTPTELTVRSKPAGTEQWTVEHLALVTDGAIRLSLFDGSRQLLKDGDVLVRLLDGSQKAVVNGSYSAANLLFKGLPFHDNFTDNYTVVASAKGFENVGFTPVRLSAGVVTNLNLMLLPKVPKFNFRQALWPLLKQSQPGMVQLLAHGAGGEGAAQERYLRLREDQPATLATFFNLTAAMAQNRLSQGTPVDYLKELVWDASFNQSGFSAYASVKLLDEIKAAAQRGEFLAHPPNLVRPGVTAAYSEIHFGEVNLWLLFFGNDRRTIDGVDCMKLAAEIRYSRDAGGHTMLAPAPPSDGMLPPQLVYQLRWMTSSQAEFKPAYTVD